MINAPSKRGTKTGAQVHAAAAWRHGLTAALAFCASPAWAQSLDYQSFESLFGEPVTTSVTGAPQRAGDVPATMEIITADQIRRSGARDIPGVLRHVAGIDVLQWTNDQADVGVRGYDQAFTPRLLVLIDGRQVYADHYGYTPWSTLPVELNAIRQIEIVKGPNSALFGFNAVGGVINIITYNPQDANADSASLAAGTQGLVQGSILKSWKIAEQSAVRIAGGYSRDNEFSTSIPTGEGNDPRPGNHKAHIETNAVFRLTDDLQLNLEASHSEASEDEINPAYAYSLNTYKSDSIRVQLNADTDIGLVQLNAYSNWFEQKDNNRVLPAFFDFRNNVKVVQLQDVANIASNSTLRVSAEYRHNEALTTPFSGGKIAYDIYAFSSMWQWNIAPGLTWTNAARLDELDLGRIGGAPAGYPLPNTAWDRSLPEYTFNSGLVWRTDENDVLRAMVGRGVQAPSLANFGSNLIVTPFFKATGDPAIDPTKVVNVEIGWDRDLPSLNGKSRVSLFYQYNSDLISIGGKQIPTATIPYTSAANIGASNADGVEFEIKGSPAENWHWGLSYRYEAVRDHFLAAAAGGMDFVDFQHVTPAHLANIDLGWSASQWELDAFARIQSATQGLQPGPFGIQTALTPVGAYVSADARIGYRLTDTLSIALSGQNLLQSAQKQTSGPDVERRVFIAVSASL